MKKGDVLRLAAATACLRLCFGPAVAGEAKKPAGVVELFTSQGCSSCPPADAIFGELVEERAMSSRSPIMSTIGTISAGRTRWPRRTIRRANMNMRKRSACAPSIRRKR